MSVTVLFAGLWERLCTPMKSVRGSGERKQCRNVASTALISIMIWLASFAVYDQLPFRSIEGALLLVSYSLTRGGMWKHSQRLTLWGFTAINYVRVVRYGADQNISSFYPAFMAQLLPCIAAAMSMPVGDVALGFAVNCTMLISLPYFVPSISWDDIRLPLFIMCAMFALIVHMVRMRERQAALVARYKGRAVNVQRAVEAMHRKVWAFH